MSSNDYWENRFLGFEFESYFNNWSHESEERAEFLYPAPNRSFSLLNDLAPTEEAKHIVLLGVLAVLIHKYEGISDILLFTPTYNNRVSKTVVPVRVKVESDMTFREILLNLKATVLDDFHHSLPLKEIFGSENEDFTATTKIGLMVDSVQRFSLFQGINPELLLVFVTKDGLNVRVNYGSGKFSKEILEGIILRYFDLLQSLLDNLTIHLNEVNLLSNDEKEKILLRFNSTKVKFPRKDTVLSLFEKQTRKTPLKIALVWKDVLLSYNDLSERVNKMAFYLKKNIGIGSGDMVGILMVPEIDFVISVLGVLKAGATYVPLEHGHNPIRRNLIIKRSEIGVLITKLPCPDLDNELRIVDLNQEMDLIKNLKPDKAIFEQKRGSETAYVIYTSGSTGEPKGVKIAHESLLNYVIWASSTYGCNEMQLDFPLFTSISFDLTLTSLFVPLISGGKIVMYGEGEQVFRLREILMDNRVSIIKLTPSHLRIIKDYEELKNAATLKKIIVGGEALDQSLALEVHEKMKGQVQIYNEYGPTEATVGCMVYKFNPKDVFHTVPIGKPIDNAGVYVLNKALEPTSWEVPGELYITGVCLAQGYFRNEHLTSSRFLDNPFKVGTKMYKTGDLVRWLPNGMLEFLDRIDNQVKIRGYRIELGEVERYIKELKEINQVVVINVKINEENYLTAYYSTNEKINEQEIKDKLEKNLPSYMLPSFLIQLETIPLSVNGKVLRKSLPDPRKSIQTEDIYSVPENEIEKKLLKIWSEILDYDENRIGLQDDFFTLGGHSILAVRLHQSIERQFQVSIGLKGIFENSTIRELAKLIRGIEHPAELTIQKVERKAKKHYESSSAQERLFCEYMMNPKILTNNCAQAFEINGELDIEKLEDSFQFLIERHEGLRCNFLLEGKDVYQTVRQHILFELEVYSSYDFKSAESVFQSFVRPFDLTKDLLFRAAIWTGSDLKKYLFVDVHHIVCDGFSMNILMNEFKKNYEGQLLPNLNISYLDYANWQRNFKHTMKREREFWSNTLAGVLPKTNLPTKRKENFEDIHESECMTLTIKEEQWRILKMKVVDLKATNFMFLISIYFLMIHKLSGSNDIIIGTDAIGRTNNELKDIVGTFVNVLPLKIRIEENVTFTSFIKSIKKCVLESFENQEFPFDEMKESINLGYKDNIFDVYFSSADFFKSEIETSRLNFYPLLLKKGVPTSRYSLELNIDEVEKNLNVKFIYSTLMYDSSTIKLFMKYYENILKIVLSDTDVQISAIELEEAIIGQ